MGKSFQIKTIIYWVCVTLGALLLCSTIITCSLFNDDTGLEENPDWKTVCTTGAWDVVSYKAEHDMGLPTCLTTLTDITFKNTVYGYTVLITSKNGQVGPFEFVFAGDNTGTFTAEDDKGSIKLIAIFSSSDGKRKLTLTNSDNKMKIILVQNF